MNSHPTHPTTPPAPNSPQAVPRLAGAVPYSPVRPNTAIDLHLDANEGLEPAVNLQALTASLGSAAFTRYPDSRELESSLARSLGVEPSRVLVTAGGDEAIDRVCRAYLEAGSELILPVPTFEMIGRYARLAQATVITTPWSSGRFPTDAVLNLLSDRTRMIAVVSPNNPTGAVACASDLVRLSDAAPHAILLIDLAYEEFADESLTTTALGLPNAIIIRTFSKAFGLAGLRVGYAAGAESLICPLRSTASPFPVSALSLTAAQKALDVAPLFVPRVVARIRQERTELHALLTSLGSAPLASQANFVLAEFPDAEIIWNSLARQGISVRKFSAASGLSRYLRITCPGNAAAFARLCSSLQTAFKGDLSS